MSDQAGMQPGQSSPWLETFGGMMKTITLPRSGRAPLCFMGKLLAHSSGREGREKATRWYDIAVYHREGNRLVAHLAYRSGWEGEASQDTVLECGSLEDLDQAISEFDCLAPVQGFPASEQYAQRQEKLLQAIRLRFSQQMGDVLARVADLAGEGADSDTAYTVTLSGCDIHRPGKMGFTRIDGWLLATIVPCRNCGGKLLWAEAGYVPGYRICQGCGRHWVVHPSSSGGMVSVTVDVPQTPDGPLWGWDDAFDVSHEAYDTYCEKVSRFGGEVSAYDAWRSRQ